MRIVETLKLFFKIDDATYGQYYFFKGLALTYIFAFFSLLFQVLGLYGSRGILPITLYVKQIESMTFYIPWYQKLSLFYWFNSDIVLQGVCLLAVMMAVFLFFNIYSGWMLLALVYLYYSFVTVGQSFLSFQWDVLLIEISFLALFLTSWGVSSRAVIIERYWPKFLIKILLFRIIFFSGYVKLASGDVTWQNFSALNFHYFTQPLPHIGGWLINLLPDSFHKISTMVMFFMELVIPFLIFVPGVIGQLALALIIALMIGIIFTGNYGFFNFLVISISLLFVYDQYFFRVLKSRSLVIKKAKYANLILFVPMVVFLFFISFIELDRIKPISLPPFLQKTKQIISQQLLVNRYGLFAVMTTQRNEIELQGSLDGKNWRSYEFLAKPQYQYAFPAWVQPYHPRLDWQMWFAALSQYESEYWFKTLVYQLLAGSPDVNDLFATVPFKTAPIFVRAKLYRYEFTNINEYLKTKRFWKRKYLGLYMPPKRL